MDVCIINGAEIAYRHRPGLGRTIVFANSLGSDQSIWDKVIAALPRGYGVLTYDLRGHGQSGGLTDTIEGLADDASQLIDALGLTDVLFCGVSIGGMIGQVLAASRADVIKAAVLCNTSFQIGTAERWETRIKGIEAAGCAGMAETIVDNWFGADYAARSERLALHRNMVGRTTDAGYRAACLAIRDADLRAHASKITCPVVCLGGAQDKSVPPEAIQALAAQIPDAEVAMFPELGHLPCLEMPEQLARLIAEFDPRPERPSEAGTRTRRAVLGDAHVDRASAGTTALDRPFQDLIADSAWGRVWADPGISARERSMLTLALLAALGNFEEIPMHVWATIRTGASATDILQAFQHVAIYAGVPRAYHALKLAKQTLAEMDAAHD